MIRIRAFVPAAAALSAACGAGPSTGGTVVRDSAGITIVENDYTRPAWGSAAWRLSGEPVLQIGAVSSDGPDQLYGVFHSRILPDGSIAIVNSRAHEVRIFDGRGRYVRTIGREGDGPGEFRSPWHAYPMTGDSLLVVDLYRAVSIFGPDGEYVRRFVPGEMQGELQGAPIGRFADGTLFFQRYQREDRTRTGIGRSQIELVRFDMNGAIATNFGLFDDQTIHYGSGPQYMFGARAGFAAGDSTIVYSPGDRIELRKIALDGTVRRLIRLDLPLRPVTEADRDGEIAAIAAANPAREELIRRRYADAEAPSHFPAHYAILVDDRDHIWVQDYQPFRTRVPRVWQVFDPEGRYLGAVTFPAGFAPHQITGNRVIGRWTDDLDVEYVRVYRIENR